MKKDQIDKLLSDLPGLRHLENRNGGKLVPGDWFLFETSPLPSPGEIELVLSDIVNNRMINVSPWGKVNHSKHCTSEKHDLTKILKECSADLTSQKFRVALWEGHRLLLESQGFSTRDLQNRKLLFGGQPIFIVTNPEISYLTYPEHPHLNTCILPDDVSASGLYLPDSICYSDEHDDAGEQYVRIRKSFMLVCIWLLRHQVWEALKNKGYPQWIGPDNKFTGNLEFRRYYDPLGKCRCGCGKQYSQCHMMEDYKQLNVGNSLNLLHYLSYWKRNREIPHQAVMSELNRMFDRNKNVRIS